MLVLTRKIGETIIIGEHIEIKVIEAKGDQIKLGISAPKDVEIHRKEVYESIQNENRQAVNNTFSLEQLLGEKK
ncbi:carbon storage regulator CsrA [Bacillus massiliigorillae]|uniref:carbon storage regulator CsrA n=1 Tax=Bacillus massiliigorillae TaxID=1243664 RepID=UPI0003A7EA4B|nr:carbon storage regulator CsrA [Bacillus massiliigorillae]